MGKGLRGSKGKFCELFLGRGFLGVFEDWEVPVKDFRLLAVTPCFLLGNVFGELVANFRLFFG